MICHDWMWKPIPSYRPKWNPPFHVSTKEGKESILYLQPHEWQMMKKYYPQWWNLYLPAKVLIPSDKMEGYFFDYVIKKTRVRLRQHKRKLHMRNTKKKKREKEDFILSFFE